jgi:hypothetical protein
MKKNKKIGNNIVNIIIKVLILIGMYIPFFIIDTLGGSALKSISGDVSHTLIAIWNVTVDVFYYVTIVIMAYYFVKDTNNKYLLLVKKFLRIIFIVLLALIFICLVILFFMFGMSLALLLEKVYLPGSILLIVSLIVLVIAVLLLGYNHLYHYQYKYKILLFLSLFLFLISSYVVSSTIIKYKYYQVLPTKYVTTKTYTYPSTGNYYLMGTNATIKIEEDKSLTDKIEVVVINAKKVNKYHYYESKHADILYLDINGYLASRPNYIYKSYKLFKSDLKKHIIHNYVNLRRTHVIIKVPVGKKSIINYDKKTILKEENGVIYYD